MRLRSLARSVQFAGDARAALLAATVKVRETTKERARRIARGGWAEEVALALARSTRRATRGDRHDAASSPSFRLPVSPHVDCGERTGAIDVRRDGRWKREGCSRESGRWREGEVGDGATGRGRPDGAQAGEMIVSTAVGGLQVAEAGGERQYETEGDVAKRLEERGLTE